MFREALGYPTRPPRGGRAVLVGGSLLVLVGAVTAVASVGPGLLAVGLVAVLPWLLVRGYYVRTIRATIGRDHPVPPGFGGVGGLLRDGVAAVVVAVGYLLPPTAVLAPLVFARTQDTDPVTLLVGAGAGPGSTAALTAVVGVLALFAVFLLAGVLYALPVAVATYAATGRLRAAFDVRRVAGGAATEDYVVAWGVSLLLQLLVLPVAYLLKPILVGFYVHFLVAVAVRYCYGQGVGAAMALGPVETAGASSGEAAAVGEAMPAVRPIEATDVDTLRPTAASRGGTDRADGDEDTRDRDTRDRDTRDRDTRDRGRSEGERT